MKRLFRPRNIAIAIAIPTILMTALIAAGYSRANLTAPAPTLILRDRHGVFLAETGTARDADGGYWAVTGPLPPKVVAATLAAEDRRFWEHHGIDPRAVGRAVVQNARNQRRVSGASTIAMQVARMQRPGSRSYARKLVEATTALFLVRRHGREEVLRHYLRLAPYGNRIRGIGYASRRYLDKPVEDLSWAESAFLAALPQAPGRMNPLSPSGYGAAVARGRRILGWLHDEGALSTEEYEHALVQIATLRVPVPGRRADESLHAVLRLERELRGAPFAGRPIVDTTLDLELQRALTWKAQDAVKSWEADGAGNAAIVVLDVKTFEVLAWVGSTDFFDGAHAGSIDYTQVPRSPGSTLKPFFYALALDRGTIAPDTVLDDLRRAEGGIGNADGKFLGPMLPRQALANSRNTTAVEVLERTGFDESFEFLGRLGLHDEGSRAMRYGPGLAVGNAPVTLDALVRAYGALAGEGMLRDPVWWRGQPAAPAQRVLSEDAARRIALHLADPVARLPTFPRMGATEFAHPVAVKTGTSSNYRDAWTVAWSTKYLVGVWVGHPDYRPMRELSGFRSAAELAAKTLSHLHGDDAHGLADLSFPPPRGTSLVRLCAMSGRRATDACERSVGEWFAPGAAPVEDCAVHVRRAVDARTGALATRATPVEHAQVRTFSLLPARYAAWAASAGLPSPPESLAASPLERVAANAEPTLTTAVPRIVLTGEKPTALKLASPRAGLRILRDPETPSELSTLSLEVVVDPPVSQVVWYVDGKPWKVTSHPYEARWPLALGEHTFQARLPYQDAASAVVKVHIE